MNPNLRPGLAFDWSTICDSVLFALPVGIPITLVPTLLAPFTSKEPRSE